MRVKDKLRLAELEGKGALTDEEKLELLELKLEAGTITPQERVDLESLTRSLTKGLHLDLGLQ